MSETVPDPSASHHALLQIRTAWSFPWPASWRHVREPGLLQSPEVPVGPYFWVISAFSVFPVSAASLPRNGRALTDGARPLWAGLPGPQANETIKTALASGTAVGGPVLHRGDRGRLTVVGTDSHTIIKWEHMNVLWCVTHWHCNLLPAQSIWRALWPLSPAPSRLWNSIY